MPSDEGPVCAKQSGQVGFPFRRFGSRQSKESVPGQRCSPRIAWLGPVFVSAIGRPSGVFVV